MKKRKKKVERKGAEIRVEAMKKPKKGGEKGCRNQS